MAIVSRVSEPVAARTLTVPTLMVEAYDGGAP